MSIFRARERDGHGDGSVNALPTFTPRELSIVRLRCLGLRNAHIAARLGIAPQTVKNTMSVAMDRFWGERGSAGKSVCYVCYLMGMADAAGVLGRERAGALRADDV